MRLFSSMVAGCCLLLASCSSGVFLEQARSIPEGEAPNQYGKMVSLKEACSGPWAVVFFYPEADTPG